MTDLSGTLRRSSRKRKVNTIFTPKTTIRLRGTGKRIVKKQCNSKETPPQDTNRDIRVAVNKRAAPLIAKINSQDSKVCMHIGLLFESFMLLMLIMYLSVQIIAQEEHTAAY